MRKLRPTPLEVEIARGVVKGMGRGAVAGGVAAVVTGAALIALPVPGAAVVCVATVGKWATVGSVVGGVAGGVQEWYRHRRIEKEFGEVFGAPVPA